MMKTKIEVLFDPELYKCLEILEIKFSFYFKFPKGKKKYYISIKRSIDLYKHKDCYKFPMYDVITRTYSDIIVWSSLGNARYYYQDYYPRKGELYLSWDSISL